MPETNGDDRLHVRLEWPADDQRASARPRSRSAAAKKSGASARRTTGTAKKKAPAKAEPAEDVAPASSPRRARPLQATTRRAPRAAGSRSRNAESRGAESGVVLTGKGSAVVGVAADPALASSLPAVADRVDALTHALISLHSLVSDRLSDQSAQIMDLIDGSVSTLARRDDEQTKTLEDLAAQVRALREGQGELVSALTELLQRSEAPPPTPAGPRPSLPVSPLRRRVSRWLSGAADSVGAPRPPGG